MQEFQVLTQNFKAEYEKAASAIITAITKSGGNRFTGELFNFYQDKRLVENETMVRNAQDLFVKGRDDAEADVRALAMGRVAGRSDRQGPACSSSGPTRRTGRTATPP